MSEKKFAVLIDAENIDCTYWKSLYEKIVNKGVVTRSNAYTDWTKKENLEKSEKIKPLLLKYAINPVQKFAYSQGKNSSDTALIIDAMDILYEGKVDGFCIVSSDSDFTGLAMRLKSASMHVIVMGKEDTSLALRNACDEFIELKQEEKEQKSKTSDKVSVKAEKNSKDNSGKADKATKENEEKSKNLPKNKKQNKNTVEERSDDLRERTDTVEFSEDLLELKSQISGIIEEQSDDDGWAMASSVGTILKRMRPDFDCKSYGCKKMLNLYEKLGFETQKQLNPKNKENPNGLELYVRLKN